MLAAILRRQVWTWQGKMRKTPTTPIPAVTLPPGELTYVWASDLESSATS